MAKPTRVGIAALVVLGFGRLEVQAVMRKFHKKGLGLSKAKCVKGFHLVRLVLSRDLPISPKIAFEEISKYANQHPEYFANMILAIRKSEARMGEAKADKSNLDKLIETKFAELSDPLKFPIHKNVFSSLDDEGVLQAKTKVSELNRCVDFWMTGSGKTRPRNCARLAQSAKSSEVVLSGFVGHKASVRPFAPESPK